ncbi:Niemann-Pick C2 protein [Mytilus galloprovincialis]|uniref:Niemann-Pick C2 protein n=1 Tax=Mytilus galloprovincialis TaxID=29158 RepID=A0A8B6F0S7_MYTGA|nr:Niemann-Pick C2 protein [Mytilus galloprovincialis]
MDKFIAAVILVVCMSVDLSSGKTPFHTCKSGSSKVTNVVIPGCDAPPCKLKKGSSAALSISFTAGEGYTKVTADVHGVISYVPVPFTPPNVDGCQHSGLTCPLTKGKNYVYNNAIPIKSSYPNLELVVRWELLDENNKDILCIEIPAEISD